MFFKHLKFCESELLSFLSALEGTWRKLKSGSRENWLACEWSSVTWKARVWFLDGENLCVCVNYIITMFEIQNLGKVAVAGWSRSDKMAPAPAKNARRRLRTLNTTVTTVELRLLLLISVVIILFPSLVVETRFQIVGPSVPGLATDCIILGNNG